MIPARILPRLSACSESELAVLWAAVESLLDGLEKGRAPYGSTPGLDRRDYIAEARDELRDGLLYLAMHQVQRSGCECGQRIHAGFCPCRGGEGVKP